MPSMSQIALPVFNQMLGALDAILDRLAGHCEAKGIDPAVFLQSRLYPDMFPFTRQVQIGCDFAKGCAARLAGEAVPSWPDDETTIPALKARIAKTLAYANEKGAAMDGKEAAVLRIKLGRNAPETEISGLDYLTRVVLPNFYFHVTTAYAILRHNGVEIGKSQYLGRA